MMPSARWCHLKVLSRQVIRWCGAKSRIRLDVRVEVIVCDMFQSHSPIPLVRRPFWVIIHVLVSVKADIKITHIPGIKNIYADALSCNKHCQHICLGLSNPRHHWMQIIGQTLSKVSIQGNLTHQEMAWIKSSDKNCPRVWTQEYLGLRDPR